jgi:hypothetical protein
VARLVLILIGTVCACSLAPDAQQSAKSDADDRGAAQSTAGNSAAYVALAGTRDFLTPDTGDVGSLEVRDGCLTFVTERGERHLPVFPVGTTLLLSNGGDGVVRMNGVDIPLRRTSTLKGGVSAYSPTPAPPGACPKTTFLVGGVL